LKAFVYSQKFKSTIIIANYGDFVKRRLCTGCWRYRTIGLPACIPTVCKPVGKLRFHPGRIAMTNNCHCERGRQAGDLKF
ncbi:MAG: hypothetical protein WC430_04010, partial [Patescibacteria group bacterium]